MARIVGDPVITVINLVSIIIGTYGVYGILSLELPAHLADAGHWQFLTNLSLVYSIVVFAVGFAAHVARSEKLYVVKNTMHPIGLALETIVAGIYWPLRIFCLHLLVKDPQDFKLPLLTDLCIHLMPVASLLVDYLVFMPRWTLTTRGALVVCAGLTGAYWVHLKRLVDYEHGAEYPYTFLNVDNEHTRMAIFSVVGFAAFAQFLVMRSVYDWVVKSTDSQIAHDVTKKVD